MGSARASPLKILSPRALLSAALRNAVWTATARRSSNDTAQTQDVRCTCVHVVALGVQPRHCLQQCSAHHSAYHSTQPACSIFIAKWRHAACAATSMAGCCGPTHTCCVCEVVCSQEDAIQALGINGCLHLQSVLLGFPLALAEHHNHRHIAALCITHNHSCGGCTRCQPQPATTRLHLPAGLLS